MSSSRDARKNVAVYGQGFVGITLSAALANLGHKVYGVDVQESLIKRLKDNDIHVFEPGLNDIVAATQEAGRLEFATGLEQEKVDYYIVAVGTPVNDEGIANLNALDAVTQSIGKRLKRGDVVMLRSTVPVGTTRNVVRGILEEISGLEAGVDFHLAFAPERTAEGKAMEELRSLPQIVGGLSSLCAKRSIELWSSLTDSVVQVDSLEAAELVKLINNSFRDLSFAFANSVALLGDRFNINAFKLINAANEGYPRNRIPLPSPGVGGYCLTKDPFLFASVDKNSGHAKLAVNGRRVNEEAQSYALKQVKRYLQRKGKEIADTRIFIVGLAFKGWPETNDLRGSSSIFIAQELQKLGATVVGYDNVVSYDDWKTFLPNAQPGTLEADLSDSDVVLIMNNHPKNIPSNFLSLIRKGAAKMVFDGWSMLDSNAFRAIDNVDYATMGYISLEK
jgi:nucleotide sugar dehydrogenase